MSQAFWGLTRFLPFVSLSFKTLFKIVIMNNSVISVTMIALMIVFSSFVLPAAGAAGDFLIHLFIHTYPHISTHGCFQSETPVHPVSTSPYFHIVFFLYSPM